MSAPDRDDETAAAPTAESGDVDRNDPEPDDESTVVEAGDDPGVGPGDDPASDEAPSPAAADGAIPPSEAQTVEAPAVDVVDVESPDDDGGDGADEEAVAVVEVPTGPDPERAAIGARRVMVVTIAVTIVAFVAIGIGAAVVIRGLEPAPRIPEEIDRTIPGENAAILRQDSVGVDLEATYRCNLEIDGIQIPPDQLSGTEEVGECLYRPGPGQEIEEFAPGRHDVLVTFWPATDPDNVKFHRFLFEVR